MIFDIVLLILFVVWILLYIKNKNAIKSLPYLLMIFITPFYNFLDQKVFVEIFGLGTFLSKKIESKKNKIIYYNNISV